MLAKSDLLPGVEVALDDFYIASKEVTVGEFRAFADETGYKTIAELRGKAWLAEEGEWREKEGASWRNALPEMSDHMPVVLVSWYDTLEYCNWRSKKEGLKPVYAIDKSSSDPGNLNPEDPYKWRISVDWTADGYRLPTDAEWEYAAIGGRLSRGTRYAGGENLADVAWHFDNAENRVHPVGQKQPNELGLYDMSGNAAEWVWDWYNDRPPTPGSRNPRGVEQGTMRFVRGASWLYLGSVTDRAHVADHHYFNEPWNSVVETGFRVARTAK